MNIAEKVVTAILSGIIFSLSLSFAWDNWGYFPIYLVVSFGMFSIVGTIFSIIADKVTVKVKSIRYLYLLFWYLIGGVLLNIFFYLFLFAEGFGRETFNMLILGVIASLLYMHIHLFKVAKENVQLTEALTKEGVVVKTVPSLIE